MLADSAGETIQPNRTSSIRKMKEYPALTPAHLRELVGFAAVARHLNFARAAREVGCTASVLSRRIAALEQLLGGPLFLRSTRRVSLTTMGETLVAHCEALESSLAELNAELQSQHAEPAGQVRLHLPTSYGRRQVAPLLAPFLSRYPRIRLDLHFDDAYSDLIAARADVAIRIGQFPDSGLVSRGLRPIRRFLCAAPAYLATMPALAHPQQLQQHRCLGFSPLRSGEQLLFGEGKQRISVHIQPIMRANNAEALYEAVLGGAGTALLSDFIAGDAIADGRLVELLPAWPVAQPQVRLVWVAGAERASRVRVLIDYLGERLGKP